jgi:hypothetical protein
MYRLKSITSFAEDYKWEIRTIAVTTRLVSCTWIRRVVLGAERTLLQTKPPVTVPITKERQFNELRRSVVNYKGEHTLIIKGQFSYVVDNFLISHYYDSVNVAISVEEAKVRKIVFSDFFTEKCANVISEFIYNQGTIQKSITTRLFNERLNNTLHRRGVRTHRESIIYAITLTYNTRLRSWPLTGVGRLSPDVNLAVLAQAASSGVSIVTDDKIIRREIVIKLLRVAHMYKGVLGKIELRKALYEDIKMAENVRRDD